MIHQTGPEYIAHCRGLGFTDPEIRTAMAKVGWQEPDLNTAFSQAEHISPRKKGLSTKLLWVILSSVLFLLLALVGLVVYVLAIA